MKEGRTVGDSQRGFNLNFTEERIAGFILICCWLMSYGIFVDELLASGRIQE